MLARLNGNRQRRIGWILMITTMAGAAAIGRPPRPPKDAPLCLASATRPVFVAPMGEVFRAEPGQPYPAARWIGATDGDGDGRISRTEMAADAARFFRRLDGNGDGRLTPDEVARYENEVAPEIALYAGRREDGPRRRAGLFATNGDADYAGPIGAGRFSWLNIPEPVAAADADLDRVVTMSEFTQAADRRFDALARGEPAMSPATLPRTPQQAALEGPCRPPAIRRSTIGDGLGDPGGAHE